MLEGVNGIGLFGERWRIVYSPWPNFARRRSWVGGADRLRVYAVKPILAALAFTLRTDAIRITVIYTRLNARFIL